MLEALQAPALVSEPIQVPAAPAAAVNTNPIIATTDTLTSVVAALTAARDAANNAAILVAISNVPTAVLSTKASDMSSAAGPFAELKGLVQSLSTDSGTTAPVRRKAVRALEAMNSAVAAAASKTVAKTAVPISASAVAAVASSAGTVVLHNPPPGPSLDAAIAAVKSATTAAQLEEVGTYACPACFK